MIINNLSSDIDDISSALDKYIICRRWILQKNYLDTNYLPWMIFFCLNREIFVEIKFSSFSEEIWLLLMHVYFSSMCFLTTGFHLQKIYIPRRQRILFLTVFEPISITGDLDFYRQFLIFVKFRMFSNPYPLMCHIHSLASKVKPLMVKCLPAMKEKRKKTHIKT
jgi:hypothetical protein